MSSGQLLFLPWVRDGAASQLSTADGTTGPRNNATVQVAVKVNGTDVPGPPVRMLGPGDVVGIDITQVIRTDPTPGMSAFESERLVVLELDDPSLPWLFTPAAPSPDHERLRPWLALVVVRRQKGVGLTPDPVHRRSVLRITAPAIPDDELPDPQHAWAWAHVQVTGGSADPEQVRRTLSSAPARTLSRLLCPRQLAPHTAYVACLVPTFAAGRDAGLGRPVDPDGALTPAWSRGETEAVLPVYHSWEFATGEGGDFASLVGRLRGAPAPVGVGQRSVRISVGGADDVLSAGGALGRTAPHRGPAQAVPERVRTLLAALFTGAGEVHPPVYASAQSGRPAPAAGDTGWLAELNLDPRWRVAAALGAAVVQDRQDDLVAAAWQQAGPVREVNDLIRRAGLAAQANASLLRRRLQPLPTQALLEVTAPVHRRLGTLPKPRTGSDLGDSGLRVHFGQLVQQLQRQSSESPGTLTGAHRKATRPGGPLDRAARAAGWAAAPGTPLAAAVTAIQTPERNDLTTRDALTAEKAQLSAAVHDGLLGLLAPAQRVAERLAARIQDSPTSPAAVRSFADAPTAAPPGLDSSARATGLPTMQPRLVAPKFDLPLYSALARMAPDAILPGSNEIPSDTVVLLEPDPAFVAAFLAGFNSELARELVWRGFPVDVTATFARSFWDYRTSSRAPRHDIPAISDWAKESSLAEIASGDFGGGSTGSGSDEPRRLVLCVRGELLRRYPRTHVYATRADWVQQPGGSRRLLEPPGPADVEEPVFSGALGPDLRFFGFDLDAETVRGTKTNPGWFFAFQEQPVEARFGGSVPTTAGLTSADVAIATLRPPVRHVIHADILLDRSEG